VTRLNNSIAPDALAIVPKATRGRSLLNDPLFLALAREYEARFDPPRRASVRDVTEGHWYALALVPGRERKAIGRVADETWLPTYVPTVQYIGVCRGRLVNIRRALFTGYGFACVKDMDEFFGRIKACDGVLGILCEGGEAVPIYQLAPARFVEDAPRRPPVVKFDRDLIEHIRAIERGENWSLAYESEKRIAAATPRQPHKSRKSKAEKAKRKAKRKKKKTPAPLAEAA
jgi:Transcription termination factor nusG